MTVKDTIESFLLECVEFEVKKLLPWAATAVTAALPGPLKAIAAALLSDALQSQAVQDKLVELESKGIEWLLTEGEKGFDELEKLVVDHLQGKLKELAGKLPSAETLMGDAVPGALHLTAEQVQALATKTVAEFNAFLGL